MLVEHITYQLSMWTRFCHIAILWPQEEANAPVSENSGLLHQRHKHRGAGRLRKQREGSMKITWEIWSGLSAGLKQNTQ